MVDIRDDGRYDGLRKLKTVEIKQSDRTDTMTMSRDDIIAGLEAEVKRLKEYADESREVEVSLAKRIGRIKEKWRNEVAQLRAALERLINAATKEFGEVEQHYFGGDIKEALDAARNILDAKNK